MTEEIGARPPRFAADDRGLPTRPDGVQLRARRSPKLIAIGVLCACLGGLGAAFLYSNAVHSQTVVLMAHAVHRGETVERADLAIVTIGAVPGVSIVPSERLDELVGQSALVDLPQGSLVGPASTGAPTVPSGTAQVGLKLIAGRVPTGVLPAGSKVLLIEVEEGKTGPGRTFSANAPWFACRARGRADLCRRRTCSERLGIPSCCAGGAGPHRVGTRVGRLRWQSSCARARQGLRA